MVGGRGVGEDGGVRRTPGDVTDPAATREELTVSAPSARRAIPTAVHRRRSHSARAGLVTAAVGLPAGLVWWLVAPRAALIVTAGGGVFPHQPENKAYIAADGWFAVVALVAGVLTGALVWARWRRGGVEAVAGLTAGGLLGALVAFAVGKLLGSVDVAARAAEAGVGAVIQAPLDVRAYGVLCLWPIAAVTVFLALVAGYERGGDRG